MKVGYMTKKIRHQEGFTLLETMIGLLVFTIGILAAASMQATALRGNYNARQITEAGSISADKVECLRPLSYVDDSELTDGSHTLTDEQGYSVSYTIQRDALLEDTMSIQVTVQWQDKGQNKTMVLDSVKADII